VNTVRTKLSVKDIMLTKADRRALDALQVRNLQQFRGWTAQMETDVVRAVSDGVTAGENIDKISGRISDAIGASKTRARRIARTESINAAVEGARNRYREYGIEQVEVIACDDWRTCTICQQHDGKIYSVDDDAHMPPYHPNCRCAIKAVVKKDKEKEPAKKAKAPKVPKVPKAPEVPKAVKPLAYKPAKTIAGAEKLLKSHGIDTNYDGLAVEVANVTNKTIIETMDIAPELRNTLKNTSSIETHISRLENDKDAILKLFEDHYRGIHPDWSDARIHNKALQTYTKDLLKERVISPDSSTWAYSDSFRIGEYDYRGVFWNNYKFNSRDLRETLERVVLNERSGFHPKGCDTVKSIEDHELGHEIDRAYNVSKDSIIGRLFNAWDNLDWGSQVETLSGYPTTKTDRFERKQEYIAECWAEYRNNPEPRPTAKAVGNRIMEIIKNLEDKKALLK